MSAVLISHHILSAVITVLELNPNLQDNIPTSSFQELLAFNDSTISEVAAHVSKFKVVKNC